MNKEKFDGHQIHVTLGELKSQIAGLEVNEKFGSVDFSEESARISYISWCLSESEPHLYWEEKLGAIQARLSSVSADLHNLEQLVEEAGPDARQNHIDDYRSRIDGHLRHALDAVIYPRVQKIFRSEASHAIAEVSSSAQRAISENAKRLRQAADENKKAVDGQQKDLAELSKLIKAEKDRLSALSASAIKWEAEAQAAFTAKNKEFDGIIEDRRTALTAWRERVEEEGQEYLEKIIGFYGMSGDATLSGRFIQAAKAEHNSYFVSMGISSLFFILAIGLTAFSTLWGQKIDILASPSQPIFEWLGRVSLVAVCVIPAFIFARQATGHRKNSSWYRTLGVRIATLKPYLAEIEGDYQDQLKEILSSFFVGQQPNDRPRKSDLGLDSKDLDSIISKFERFRGLWR